MSDSHERISKASALEREGNKYLGEKKVDEAFRAFDQAGAIYRELNDPLKAAICFASAATCWNIHTGWQPLRSAATRNEMAALEAVKAKYYSYARGLYRDAALLYEKEGDSEKYSDCYVAAQDTYIRHLQDIVVKGRVHEGLDPVGHNATFRERVKAFGHWLMGFSSWAVWGYGERPMRTIMTMAGVIFCCAAIYHHSGLLESHGILKHVGFLESLYFSCVTFATVGYGDFLPTGWIRAVATTEAFLSLFLMPLFLIALTRRYLRIYRG